MDLKTKMTAVSGVATVKTFYDRIRDTGQYGTMNDKPLDRISATALKMAARNQLLISMYDDTRLIGFIAGYTSAVCIKDSTTMHLFRGMSPQRFFREWCSKRYELAMKCGCNHRSILLQSAIRSGPDQKETMIWLVDEILDNMISYKHFAESYPEAVFCLKTASPIASFLKDVCKFEEKGTGIIARTEMSILSRKPPRRRPPLR